MKISLNWLKEFVNIPVPDEELIRLIGARLVEVEGVIDELHKYDNIYVVRVESAEKIPDTHLTLCQINVGKNELVQVLCGAPNVRQGMLAAWIAPGATVPASIAEGTPFVIGTRKMLGKYDSNGMLAAADELGFGEDHEGIIEINPDEAKPGDLLADVYNLKDLILEIENKSLTHRPDTFGLIGFAREVAGILGQQFNTNEAILAGARGVFEFDGIPRVGKGNLSVKILNDGICDRYTALLLEKHGELKKKYFSKVDVVLSKAGMKPIDPIVDATNYLMLLTGQPLHAFDYDKFLNVGGNGRADVVVRLARDGEKLVLLDDKEIVLNENDIVICSGNIPVALAGAMGGKSTMIDEDTKNVLIESATFSLYNLRKTQMAHGIFSEAITRFTKGQPAYQTLDVACFAASMLSEGFRASALVDEYKNEPSENKIVIAADEINGLLGTDYDSKLIADTLLNVEFGVKEKHNNYEIIAPLWRTDIHIKEDIIEEVGRLLGYDNIVPTLPRHFTANKNEMFDFKHDIRINMKSFGANEVLTYSFVSEKILKRAGLDEKNSYKIVNSISPDLQYVRQSIVPSLLDKAHMNQKLPVNKFAIFEMNKVYRKDWGVNDENVPTERTNMGFVLAERKTLGTAYYQAQKFLNELLNHFGATAEYRQLKNNYPEGLPFEKKRAAEVYVDDKYIGVIGEFKNSVKKNFKLSDYLAGFEISLDELIKLRKTKTIRNDFSIKDKQDLTVTSANEYSDVFDEVKKKYPEAEVTPVSIYQPDNSDEKNYTFHLVFY